MHEASWWDQAEHRDVARVYETAITWREDDETARAAESRIKQELRDRFGIEVNESSADPAVVRAELGGQTSIRDERDVDHEDARRDRDLALGLTVEADVLELQADAADERDARELRDEAVALEQDAELAWDSSIRRDEHAAQITEPTAAAAWKQADVDQARHPARIAARVACQGWAREDADARAGAADRPRRRLKAGESPATLWGRPLA